MATAAAEARRNPAVRTDYLRHRFNVVHAIARELVNCFIGRLAGSSRPRMPQNSAYPCWGCLWQQEVLGGVVIEFQDPRRPHDIGQPGNPWLIAGNEMAWEITEDSMRATLHLSGKTPSCQGCCSTSIAHVPGEDPRFPLVGILESERTKSQLYRGLRTMESVRLGILRQPREESPPPTRPQPPQLRFRSSTRPSDVATPNRDATPRSARTGTWDLPVRSVPGHEDTRPYHASSEPTERRGRTPSRASSTSDASVAIPNPQRRPAPTEVSSTVSSSMYNPNPQPRNPRPSKRRSGR